MALDTVDADFESKLDGDMKRVLEKLRSLAPPPVQPPSPEAARREPSGPDAVQALLKDEGKDPRPSLGVATRDLAIPGPLKDIPARLYEPEGRKPDGKPLPVLVFYHGGGWVIGSIDGADASARAMAKMAHCIVVSCSYRLAPEHKFPASHDDAFAAYAWVRENARSFGGDPAKVAVMGESAGGNLALNVAAMARDSRRAAAHPGLGEHGLVRRAPVAPPVHMALIYPVAGVDMNTPSYQAMENAQPLSKAKMAWFFQQATETDGDRMDPRLDLVNADLADLPGATIILAELDPLRSEGEALAKKLEEAGSEVRSHLFKGVTHTFFGMGGVVTKAFAAEELVAHNLKRAFGAALLPI